MLQILYSSGLFLGAVLLFVIQPMVARELLPVYGGTPAVWTVCMLFFQVLLLAGYSYAWFLSRLKTPWLWRVVHGVVLTAAVITLPLSIYPSTAQGSPDFLILKDLVIQLGLPLLTVAVTAPLLQFSYSQSNAKGSSDPYYLYVASNVGSLFALLGYPWLIERFWGLKQQFYIWNALYLVYLALLALIILLPQHSEKKKSTAAQTFKWKMALPWIGYSFVPCSLMLGVTFYITTDIASTPLFWVVPLALYLLTFVITFARKPIISKAWLQQNILIFLVFPILGFFFGSNNLEIWVIISIHLMGFAMLALLFHSELVQSRPPANLLTLFYCCLALGGVLAGIFNGIVAPHLFNGAYEYPLVFLLSFLCIPLKKDKGLNWVPFLVLGLLLLQYFLSEYPWVHWIKQHKAIELLSLFLLMIFSRTTINLFVGMAILFIFLFTPALKSVPVLEQKRNFYGVKQVIKTDQAIALLSQNTLHGFQLPGKLNKASGGMAYYGAVTDVIDSLQEKHKSLNTAIIGLGTGMMACQFRLEDHLDMVDIDQQVMQIALDKRFFTYLSDCPPRIVLKEGDGRQVMKLAKDKYYDLLIVDAFSSDAIPIHLLTLQALELYKEKLTAEGTILFNISNRHLRLLPVLIAAGRELDLMVLDKLNHEDYKTGQLPSEWVMLTGDEALGLKMINHGWRFAAENDQMLWTDDYSNVIPLLKW